MIQRGSVSVVIRCRTADGGPAVLKASPARERVAHEAAALAGWKTPHVPAVLAVDEAAGALLLEAVEPGNGARRIGCLPRARPPRRPHAGERSRRRRRARPRCNRPAPCLGDPAFDPVDLVSFHAGDVETIAARAEELAPAIGADAGRLLGWCVAFAGMVALEKAAQSDGVDDQLEALLALAAR